ncbi:MAG: hypothetical protein L0387_05680 [Acidobacteria bacterium]|nr:hypothetical protein [Acidobacteriota bacterium]
MFGLLNSNESENKSYDTMKLCVVKNPNGTFDLGVGLYVRSERHHYREYQKEFSTYLQALEYLKERVVVYEKTNRFHQIGLTIGYNLRVPEWECPDSEKPQTQAKAA